MARMVMLQALKDEMEAIDIPSKVSGAPAFFYTVPDMEAVKKMPLKVLQGMIDGL